MPEWKYLPQKRENKREGFVQIPTHRIMFDATLCCPPQELGMDPNEPRSGCLVPLYP